MLNSPFSSGATMLPHFSRSSRMRTYLQGHVTGEKESFEEVICNNDGESGRI